MPGFEYRSSESWRGMPLVHVAFGHREGGRYHAARACGAIAVGDTAVGVVAVGVVAAGVLARAPGAAGLLAGGVLGLRPVSPRGGAVRRTGAGGAGLGVPAGRAGRRG